MSSSLVVRSPVRRDVSEIPELAVTDLVLERLRARLPGLGDKPWVVDMTTGTQVRFCDVESQSRRVASALTRRGFQKGHVLYFVTLDMSHIFVVLLAVWRLGGITRGWYYGDAAEEITRQLSDLPPKFVLVDSETWPLICRASADFESPVALLSVGDVTVPGATSFSALLEDDGTAFPTDVKINPREDVFSIVGTSGSTGAPKPVLHTHYSAVALVMGTSEFYDMGSSLMSASVNFAVASLRLLFCSLCSGSTLYNIGKFGKNIFFQFLLKYKPEVVMIYPFLAVWLARHPQLEVTDFSFLRTIWTGAWVLDPTTVALFTSRLPHVRLCQVYGMTECMLLTTTEVTDGSEDTTSKSLKIVKNQGTSCVSTGRLLPYVQVKVVDPTTGRCLGRGERGEIVASSPCLMKGYLNEGRTGVDADGWYHTQDIGFVDPEGHVYILERLNFTFKYKTAPVSPSQIESVLQEHEAVQAAGVVGVPNIETDNLTWAVVVLRPDCHATAAELQNHVAQRLPNHKHLHGGVRFVEKLPENRGGKLDRAALKKLAMSEK